MADRPNGWWRLSRWTAGVAFQAAFRVRYLGREHLPLSGGALVAYNHLSVLDPIPVGLAIYGMGRIVRFVAVADVFEQRVVGPALRGLRQIPVHRGAGDRRAFAAALEVLEAGALVGIAPEGRVGEGPDLQPARTGAARIALLSGAPVVPVAVWGTSVRWPSSGLRTGRPWRPTVGVAFGPPIRLAGDAGQEEDVRAATEAIMDGLRVQLPRAREVATSA